MFLSIIIPIYNDEKFLAECLDSCLDQSYPKDDYEIICVDDGSTDRTPEMLKEYAARHSNIRLIFAEHGHGGRNTGYPIAKGDYIWFVDHDDIVAPDAVPELKVFVSEHPDCDRVLFFTYEFFDAMTEEELHQMKSGTLRSNDGSKHRYAVVWDGIYRRQFLLEHDILPRSKRIDEAGKYWGISPFIVWGGDTVFNEEFSDKGGKEAILPGRPLYHYRRHQGSESMTRSPEYLKKKETWVYNRALLELYLVAQQMEQYHQERAQFGEAKQETVIPLIVKLRSTLKQFAGMPTVYWKKGINKVKESNAFFDKMPPEYRFPYSSYIRLKRPKDRFLPRTSIEYFLFTEKAAKLYRFVDSFRRYRDSNNGLLRLKYRMIKSINHVRGKR